MGDNTGIEWTDATWNPIRARNNLTGKVGWHCLKVSPECTHCYAETMNRRLGTRVPYVHEAGVTVFVDGNTVTQPSRWQRPRLIFVCSMTDLFGPFVTDEMIGRVWDEMAKATRHTFQVLTKRAERMHDFLRDREPLPHVWLGVSAGTQDMMDKAVPWLLRTPAAKRWLSMEPLLESVNPKLCSLCGNVTHDGCGDVRGSIDWVVVGGESGSKARPMEPDWARRAVDKCRFGGVPVLFKQWGQWVPVKITQGTYKNLDGDTERWRYGPRYHGISADLGMIRINSKKDAGRVLDGVLWDQYPDGFGPS